jgi:hypothetical protein
MLRFTIRDVLWLMVVIGLDTTLRRRGTKGGHNDSTCRLCDGECFDADESEESLKCRNAKSSRRFGGRLGLWDG